MLTVINSTVIGKVHSARLDLASNTIFMAARFGAGDPWGHPVVSDQNQQGCVRFSFVPLNAIVPRRYRCQPDLAVTEALTAADVPKGSLSNFKKLAITAAVQARVRPALHNAALRPTWLWPAWQLLRAQGNFTGAEDESEMGAFHDVFAPRRRKQFEDPFAGISALWAGGGNFLFDIDSRLLKKTHMLRCAQSPRSNVLSQYASARRSIARLASEIFLSSLTNSLFSNRVGD